MAMESETLEAASTGDGDSTAEGSPAAAAIPSVKPARIAYNWLDAYQEYTENWEPPRIFNRWVGLLTLAAATQRRVWLEDANSRIYPNLFVVLVAPSGVGKTSAMREAMPFIEAALGSKKHISPGKITAAKFLKRFAEAQKFDDTLGVVSPYVIWSEELPSFLGSDAYKSGLVADLTTLYDCPEKWEKETKHQGSDDITGPYICLMGGTTAQGIFDVLPPGSVTQGFTARLIFVHSNYNEARVVEKPWTQKHIKLQEALLNDIQIISNLRGGAKFSDIARTLWTDYYLHRPQADQEFSDLRLQGYAARKPFYVKKLALLLSVAEGDSLVIEAHHLDRAFGLLEELDTTLRRVYEDIAPNIVIQHYAKIVRRLRTTPGGRMDRSQLMRHFSYTLDARSFNDTLQALQEMGLVEPEIVPAPNGKIARYYKLTKGGFEWSQK